RHIFFRPGSWGEPGAGTTILRVAGVPSAHGPDLGVESEGAGCLVRSTSIGPDPFRGRNRAERSRPYRKDRTRKPPGRGREPPLLKKAGFRSQVLRNRGPDRLTWVQVGVYERLPMESQGSPRASKKMVRGRERVPTGRRPTGRR